MADPDVNISGHVIRRTLDADNAPTPCRTSILSPRINDQFAGGFSLPSNHGLATEFNDTYAGGSVGGTTDLKTMNLT